MLIDDDNKIIREDQIPKILIIPLSEVFILLDDFSSKFNFISDFDYKFKRDYKNILMDLFENISFYPDVIQANVNIDLLVSAEDMKSFSGCVSEFKLLCNRLKSIIIDILNTLNFKPLIIRDKGFFNYYVQEIKGNSVILKYLKNG